MTGPRIRTDIADVYVLRRDSEGSVEFLQLRREREPAHGTWQPVMGHVGEGETAAQAALRELGEETGLGRDDPALLDFWALRQTHPYFVAEWDAVVISPRFAAEVSPDWRPRLNPEHSDWRWTRAAEAETAFVWPGQRAAVAEILASLPDRRKDVTK